MCKINNIEKVKELFQSVGLIILKEEYISSQEKIDCVDLQGYKYAVSENQIQVGNMPEKFSKFNPYTLENVQHMLDLESQGSVLKTQKYTGSKMNLTITCEICGEDMTKTWGQIIQRKNFKCKKCNNSHKKYKTQYVKQQFLNKGYNIIDERYESNNTPILCEDVEGYRVKISYSNLISSNRKPNRFSFVFNKENFVYNINHYLELNNVNCKVISYIENKIINNSVCVLCQCECGNVFETSWNSIKQGKVRCDYCTKTMSNMEFKVRKWLEENGIKYEFQKRFKDCVDKQPLPFDFYIPSFNCCIEVDGEQHYKPSVFALNTDIYKEFEKRKEHDLIKTNYCISQKIDLIRINYKEIKRKNNNYKDILSNKFIKG